jgi:DNA mismatch repair protein MutS2
MKLYPNDLFTKLEFDRVIELLKKECYGALGQVYFDNLNLESDRFLIERRLLEVEEYKLSLEESDRLPVSSYSDLFDELKMLAIPGSVLPLESIQHIYQTLSITRSVFEFFTEERQEVYPVLFEIISAYQFESGLTDAVEGVLDEEGNLRPDASPELLRIRRTMGSKLKEIDREFRKVVSRFKQMGWLKENEESVRNGRRVLSVPAEHKRKIRGIIHDESTTGKTAFIEPEGIIDINNDLFDLEQEEKREVYRILKALCDELREAVPVIRQYQTLIVRLDTIQAKARLAVQMNAHKPKLVEGPSIGIKNGLHPLLYLKNKTQEKETVAFDLKLLSGNRILVLSGPNAGGKSIAMKAVGLMQLMVQAGILIPADPLSEIGLFQEIFADIGDQQSLEDELSTYSSRLKNMKFFMENITPETLLLIDEFGSGTDPKIGGAIAEAFLHEFNQKKVFGVITTHYSNLKVFAFKNKGIVNGAMTFDKETLSPTYSLKIGRPGSSYAFEIAQKTGLDGKIIRYARNRAGKSTKAIDQLLVDLQQEKKELEEKLTDLAQREKKLERLIRNYENLHRELEFSRKKMKLEAKEKALQDSSENNRELENLIREIREKNKLEEAKKLAARVKEERGKIAEEIQGLNQEIYYQPSPGKNEEPIKEGDYVKMKTGSSVGTVESIQKNNALVVFGQIKMKVKLKDLTHANAPLEVRTTKSVNLDSSVENKTSFESKLDIRGMRKSDALKVVEAYVDQALMANAALLRIVHGKGNGVLRNVVKQKLREYQAVNEVHHPEEEQGGDGVTIAYLK